MNKTTNLSKELQFFEKVRRRHTCMHARTIVSWNTFTCTGQHYPLYANKQINTIVSWMLLLHAYKLRKTAALFYALHSLCPHLLAHSKCAHDHRFVLCQD